MRVSVNENGTHMGHHMPPEQLKCTLAFILFSNSESGTGQEPFFHNIFGVLMMVVQSAI